MTTALEGVRGQHHAPAAIYPEKDPVPIVQEVGMWLRGFQEVKITRFYDNSTGR